jgi:hypothetical protein
LLAGDPSHTEERPTIKETICTMPHTSAKINALKNRVTSTAVLMEQATGVDMLLADKAITQNQ